MTTTTTITAESLTCPSQREIEDRLLLSGKEDMFGFETGEYVAYCSYEMLVRNKLLKEDATRDSFAELVAASPALSPENILKVMLDYMPFAWDKANGMRGISANRSIMHYIAWTFLAGDGGFSEELRREFESNYHYYGKPLLEKIADRYGWNWKECDDGRRTNG